MLFGVILITGCISNIVNGKTQAIECLLVSICVKTIFEMLLLYWAFGVKTVFTFNLRIILLATPIVLSWHIKLDGKTLMLKTRHTWVIGHEERKLVLTWKVLYTTLGEESNQQSFPSVNLWTTVTTGLMRFVCRCNNGPNTGVTNHFQTGFKAGSTRVSNTCLIMLSRPKTYDCLCYNAPGRSSHYYSPKWT